MSSNNPVFSNPVSEIVPSSQDCFRSNYQSELGLAKQLSAAELGKFVSWSFTLIVYLYTHLLIYFIAPVSPRFGNVETKPIPAQIALANGDALTRGRSDALKEDAHSRGGSDALNFSSFLWALPHRLSEVSASSSPEGSLDGANLQGNLVAVLPSSTPPFAIRSEGAVYINNGGDFDGIPTEPGDDALIYAGNGFNINNNPVLPVQRDAAGNPIKDASSKLILVDRAVTVAPGYAFANASSSGLYANLLPPQVVERQTVSVPSYADVKQQELARTIPAGTPTVTFNIGQNPINSEAEWVLKFPAPGTANSPTVVQVTGGGLNIPANVNLENYVITVELGDINLSSGVNVFNNVVLVTNNGNINLSDMQSSDLSALASGFINMNGGAKFSGSTLLATGNSWANINFNGATTNVEASNNLKVISQGNITYNAASDTRGSFLSVGDFSFNNNSTLYGSIGAKGSIYFNGSATVIFAESSTSPPPVPVANLVEETNFTVTSTIGLQIPATPSILSFKIDPQFDQQDPDSINDAFEVALVDTLGNSLVHTIAKERDSFFNWTEGEEVTLGAGATYNASDRTVTLNLVGMTPGVAANLLFRLVNNDSDTTTSASITDLVVTEAPAGTLPPVQGNLETAIPVVSATPDFQALTDVSDSFSAVYHRTSFNADTKLLYADMAVRNVGQYSVGVPLLVAVRNISDPSVTVRNPDGFTPDGIPYYNVSRLVADGKLNPNDVTQLRSLVFSNPQRVQFTYDLVVLAQLNRVPVINTQPNLELIGTQPYSYDVDATDPDGDALTYKLVVAPSGMTINPTSGLISWNPAAGARGNYAVMVEANDGRLGVATQQYTLSVIDAPPNRPPLIASTPVLDAAVNTPYTYQALAVDADSDALTFSLVASPVGMSVNANTGAVTWSPAASQLGTHNVTLRVADGRNGTAEQSFAILVGPQRGNHRPLIISTPVSALNVPVGFSSAVNGSYTYDVAALDPDEDTLTYSLVAAPAGMTINASTGVVSWSPAATDVGQHQVTVLVEDGRGGRDTQSFMLDAVATYPAQLRGTVFNDLNGDGQQFNSIGNADAPVTVTGTDGNPIALTNDTTRLEVFGGLVRNGLIPGGGYYNQTDLVRNNTPTWSIDPVLLFPNGTVTVLSNANNSGAFGAPQHVGNGVVRNTSVTNGVSVQADTQLLGSNAKTTFTFTAAPGTTLDGTTFVFYAENDIAGIQNVAAFTGSIAGGDLALFQYDSGARNFTVRLTGASGPGASLNLFGAGRWTGFGAAIEAGNLAVLSADGSNFVTSGDLGLALGFSLNGTSASLVINYDNQPTPPDPGLVQVVYLDENRNGQRDATERFTTTDSNGNYAFTDLTPGTYTVASEPEPGWVITAPTGGIHQASVTSNQVVGGLNFGILQQAGGEIRGLVFNDLNRDGNRGTSEQGLENWLIYLDTNQNGRRDATERFALTDSNGNYTFSNLRPGTYTVASERQPGWIATAPTSSVSVTVSSTQVVSGINFAYAVSDVLENQPPLFAGIDPGTGISNAPTEAIAEQVLRYDALATDADGDAITYSLPVKPTGMTVDAATGVLVWQPSRELLGTHDVMLKAADGRGGVDLLFFRINVTPPNTKPLITSQPTAEASSGQSYQYQVRALDGDGDDLTYSLETAPTGMILSATTGLLTWTPIAGQVGTQSVTLTASDGKGGIDTQTFVLNVLPSGQNRAPVITSTPRTSTRLGNTYFYSIEATDSDGDALTYSLETAPTGMTLISGIVAWNPTPGQFGNNSVVLRVSDTQFAVTQSFTINVSDRAVNRAPSITSTPNTVTNKEREYQYDLTGTDPDGDYLLWSLDKAPSGMVIDPETGSLRFSPSADQIGSHDVKVRLVDALGNEVTQEFTLTVTGTNAPPRIISTPGTQAASNQPYTYTVVATDPENDPLTFSLGASPFGMTVGSNGLIQWTPQSNQTGAHEVSVRVTDTQAQTAIQTYTLQVSAAAINHPPSITSTPVFKANVGTPYNLSVQATDPDGNALTYQLIEGPTGMSIDSTTGQLTWATPVAGNYSVVVGAVDTGGLGAAQGFTLKARANQNPSISSTPSTAATPGNVYAYDIKATDPDGDLLTFSLDSFSSALGMTIDELGRLRFLPTNGDIGTVAIEITVSDGNGASVQQRYNLTVAADTVAPKVSVIASFNQVSLGESVTFFARATDNIKVASVQLLVNNAPVALDAYGLATVTLNQLGTVTAQAIALDSSGNTGQATTNVLVIDSTDTEAPVVNLNLGALSGGVITAPIDIMGTASDSNLDYYTIDVAPVSGGDFKEIGRGTSSVTNGILGKFDPSELENDTYRLRLSAYDTGGNGSVVEDTLSVAGELKLGNFRLSFTDLSLSVTGIPITLTRTYDTLTSNIRDDFGYGWRLEFRDTDLRTSVLPPDELLTELGARNPFVDGTRVYITLPGGKREGFAFKPTIDPLSKYLASVAAGEDSDPFIYHPAFVADKGVTSTLRVQDTRIIHGAGTNEYYGLAGSAYNPADSYYGGKYILTTKEGIVYEIDAAEGDLLTVTDTNGNKLTYTDGGITSSTGKQITFERDAIGRITSVEDPSGELIRYQYDANGDLVSVSDRQNNTTRFEYNTTRPHYLDKIIDPLGRTGVRNEYDTQGRLIKMVDANGNPVEMVYDPANSVQTVKDQLGNATTYEYDARGNILTEIDALGGIIRRTFDDSNNLLTQTDPEGNTTIYTYDNKRNPITVTDPLGNTTRYTFNRFGQILTRTNPLGNTTSYTYDDRGNRLSLTNTEGNVAKYSFDSSGRLTAIVDADNKATQFYYDQFGNLIRQVDALGNETAYTYNANGKQLTESLTVTTPNGSQTQVTSWTYNAEGHVASKTDPEGNVIRNVYDKLGNLTAMIDPLGRRTEYHYNGKGQILETIYADGTSTRSVYDSLGREIATIDQAGQTTYFTYDALGRPVETIYADNTPNDLSDNPRTRTEYDKAGRTIAQVDERGNRNEYAYDAVGRKTLVRDALGNKTTYTYNAVDNRLTETDALGHTTQFVYNDLGRKVRTIFADGTSASVTYDALGRRSSVTDQAGHTTYFKNDALDRLIEVIHPDDTPNDLSDNPRTKTEYNELGQVIAQIDELGNREEFKYDAAGRLIESCRDCQVRRQTYTYDAAGNKITETDPLGRTTGFVYDQLNRLTQTHFPDGSHTVTTYEAVGRTVNQTDQAGKTTQFEYDPRGRLTGVVDALQQRTEYGYDKAGNLIQVKDALNHITQHEYNALNRRTATILPMGQRSSTTYDSVGNIASTTDFNGDTITYRYDALNRMSAKLFPDITAVEYTYTPTGKMKTVKDQRGVTTYQYDARDRLTERTEPDGRFIPYTYDAASNRTGVITPTGTTAYTYDRYKQLKTVTDPNGGVTTYTYDKAGNLISTELPNGTVETRQYNDLSRLVYLENKQASGGIISSYRYTLDAAGNLLAVEEHNGRKVNYTYDDLYRLSQEKITDTVAGNRTISYTYDPVGNRLTRNDAATGLTTYVYDGNDRLLSETLNGQVTSYTYNNNGNTLTSTNSTSPTVYDWDYENRLVEADITTATGTTETKYHYNADGIRVASIVNGQETRYLIDANQPHAQVIEEYISNGTVQASYVYGKDLISQNREGQQSFYHVDGLGSTKILTNASGNVTDTYTYDAYGNLIESTGNTVNNYLYTGEQYDPNLGNYYLRARYYNPSVGRFSARDPFEGVMTDPLSLAKYPYVRGNPVNTTDPSGLFFSSTETAAAFSIETRLAVTAYMMLALSSRTYESEGIVPGYLVGQGNDAVDELARRKIGLQELQGVNIIINKIRECNMRGSEEECDFGDFPVIVWGDNITEIRDHTSEALAELYPSFLRYISTFWSRDRTAADNAELIRRYGSNALSLPNLPISWYNVPEDSPCFWNPFGYNPQHRNAQCDEYPYASTLQGGRANYYRGGVHLEFVSQQQNSLQGNMLRRFYAASGVATRMTTPFAGWFGVEVTFNDNTHWRRNNKKVENL